jgi:hypothetical protein
MALIAFGLWLFRPQLPPVPPVAPLCPQLAPLASSTSAAASNGTTKIVATIKQGSEGNVSPQFASDAQTELQQVYQAIDGDSMGCLLVLQASLCAYSIAPAGLLAAKYAEVAVNVCPSFAHQQLPPTLLEPAMTARSGVDGGVKPELMASAIHAMIDAGVRLDAGRIAVKLSDRADGGGGKTIWLEPDVASRLAEYAASSSSRYLPFSESTVARSVTDCMSREARTVAGECTGPRLAAGSAASAANNEACGSSHSNLFYGDTQPSFTTLYWYVCINGERAPFDCKCTGKAKVP